MTHEGNEHEATSEQITSTFGNDEKTRLEAIRALAGSAHASERSPQEALSRSVRPSMLQQPKRMSHGRRAAITVAIITVLIAVGIIARGVLLNGADALVTQSAPASVRLDLNALGYSCPAAMAWSPDGSKLAVLAQKGAITPDQMSDPCVSNTILVFNSQNGSLMERFDISAPLRAANASLTMRHDVPSWSPNGKLLALPCVVATQLPAHPVDLGVLLVPVSGTQPFIIHASVDLSQHDMTVVWDTQDSKLASVMALPLTPAEDYQIGSSGRLETSNPLHRERRRYELQRQPNLAKRRNSPAVANGRAHPGTGGP